jgi:hypothetical protein
MGHGRIKVVTQRISPSRWREGYAGFQLDFRWRQEITECQIFAFSKLTIVKVTLKRPHIRHNGSRFKQFFTNQGLSGPIFFGLSSNSN